jgi:hypothetical protein
MSSGKTKKCRKCCVELPLTSEFWNRAAHCSDGFHTQCKICRKQQAAEYRKNNSEKIKTASKKCREKYKDKNKQYRDEWYAKNPDYNKKYYEKNKTQMLEQHTKYWNNRYQNDPEFRIKHNFRRRLLKFLEGNVTARMEYYVGCTLAELKLHIESLWLEGMTWENHSFTGWHIDHIVPVSSFDYNEGKLEESLKKCWHYSNLQPLWAKDNLAKSNKLLSK